MKKKISLVAFFCISAIALIFIISKNVDETKKESTLSINSPRNTTDKIEANKKEEKIYHKNDATESASRKNNLTNDIIKLGSIEDAFLETEKQMTMSLAAIKSSMKNGKKLNEKQQEKVEQFLENVFSDGAEMLASFQENLNSNFSEEELLELKDILAHPVLQKINEANKNLTSEDIAALYKDAQQNKMDTDRETILNQYIEEANLMDQTINMATNINYASVVAQQGVQEPEVASKTLNAIKNAIEQKSDTIKNAVKTALYVETKVASNNELKTVVDINKKAIMKKYNSAILKSMESSIVSNDNTIDDLGAN